MIANNCGGGIFPHSMQGELTAMKKEKLQLSALNVISSEELAVAVSVTTFFNNEKLPDTTVIRIAVAKEKIPTGVLDIPVYLPANINYKTDAYYKMLELFRQGEPFVPVQFENLKIHISKAGNYYGVAQSFLIRDYLSD